MSKINFYCCTNFCFYNSIIQVRFHTAGSALNVERLALKEVVADAMGDSRETSRYLNRASNVLDTRNNAGLIGDELEVVDTGVEKSIRSLRRADDAHVSHAC
jgi:hypothetical protein